MILMDLVGHLVSDSNLEELHAFARSVGLRREWFQPGRRTNRLGIPHYDVTTERARARVLGTGRVQAVSRKDLVRLARTTLRREELNVEKTLLAVHGKCSCAHIYTRQDTGQSVVGEPYINDLGGIGFAECPHIPPATVRPATAADHAEALGLTATDLCDAQKDARFEQPRGKFVEALRRVREAQAAADGTGRDGKKREEAGSRERPGRR